MDTKRKKQTLDENKNINPETGAIKWKLSFFTVVIGQTVSLIGSAAVQFALIWWLSSSTGSALMLGMAGMVSYLPMLLLSPLAGVLADRHNRKIICIASDIFVGLSALAFAVLLWIYELPVWIVLFILLMRGIGNTFQTPAIRSILPQLVPKEHLVQANSWNQMMHSGSYILAPILGAALYAALPMSTILLSDLVGALFASFMIMIVKVPKLVKTKKERPNFSRELKEGWEIYLTDKRLLLIIIAETICLIFYMPLTTFFPLMISNHFKAGSWYASFGSFACGLGMLIASFVVALVLKKKEKIKVSYMALVFMGLAIALSGILPSTLWACWIFIFLCIIIGGSGNAHSIPLISYMQSTIPPEKMGRAFSFLGVTSALTMPLGLLLASPLAEFLGIAKWFLISGIAITMISVITMSLDKYKF